MASAAFVMMARELQRCAYPGHKEPRQYPYKGLALRESVTYRVYRILLLHYPEPLQAWQLRQTCGAGRGAVAWAVRYLRQIERIDCLPDDGRHLHYLRYRARL